MRTDTQVRKTIHYTGLTWEQAGWFAAKRAAWTICVGLAAAAVALLALLAAPQIEERWFPAIADVRLVPDKALMGDPDLLAFRVAFTKTCACPSLGRSWFFLMSDGTLIRVQAQQPEGVLSASARPPGRQVGQLQILRKLAPREGVDRAGRPVIVKPEAVVGTSAVDRGLPWTSTVTIGPFPIEAFRHPAPITPDRALPGLEELP